MIILLIQVWARDVFETQCSSLEIRNNYIISWQHDFSNVVIR